MSPSIDNMMLSLEGLSVGDSFGEIFFSHTPSSEDDLPPGPWHWTDDTHMALSIVDVLCTHGHIDQDKLAASFAERFLEQPNRGYAGGARRLLTRIATGTKWREAAPSLFGGGSYGNGGAMRAAPIGGFFSGDPARASEEGRLSAVVTHAHPEGAAGAMAVAAAAAIAAASSHPEGNVFLLEIMQFVPDSLTRRGIEAAIGIPSDDLAQAATRLGTGLQVSSQDTVPFCLWSAAHHLKCFAEALWLTAAGLGDSDTTCAIVGGIVALSSRKIPTTWLSRREPLPPGFSRGKAIAKD